MLTLEGLACLHQTTKHFLILRTIYQEVEKVDKQIRKVPSFFFSKQLPSYPHVQISTLFGKRSGYESNRLLSKHKRRTIHLLIMILFGLWTATSVLIPSWVKSRESFKNQKVSKEANAKYGSFGFTVKSNMVNSKNQSDKACFFQPIRNKTKNHSCLPALSIGYKFFSRLPPVLCFSALGSDYIFACRFDWFIKQFVTIVIGSVDALV